MKLALRTDQPREAARPLRSGLRLALGALVAAGLIGTAVPRSTSAAPHGGIPTPTATRHPIATSTPSKTPNPSATPLQLSLTKLYANHTTGEVGRDEPYLIIFAADLSKPKGRGVTTKVDDLSMNANGHNIVYPNVPLWPTDASKAPINNTEDVLVLAAMMENDSDSPEQVRRSVDSVVQDALATNHSLPYSSLVSKLRSKMNSAINAALKHDERIGLTQSVSVTSGDVLDATNGQKPGITLRFIGHNANYEATFTLSR